MCSYAGVFTYLWQRMGLPTLKQPSTAGRQLAYGMNTLLALTLHPLSQVVTGPDQRQVAVLCKSVKLLYHSCQFCVQAVQLVF